MDLVCKPRGKSLVWLYFGFKANEKGQPINTREAVCRLCRKIVLSRGGSTTNLRSHLHHRHRADLGETASGGFLDPQGLDTSHDEIFENLPLLQSTASQTYVADALLPPAEPWLHAGPSRAALSVPSCLFLHGDVSSGLFDRGPSGEDRGMETGVYAKCFLQRGVLFGPFVGEVCRGEMPANLKYAWAIRDDASFSYVDASDENKSNWMRYVTYASSKEDHNLVVSQFDRHIYYKVSQPIPEGAELKVWIGQSYATLLGLEMGDSVKCEVRDKEAALRLLQDIQLVTLPEPSSTSPWPESSQSLSPTPKPDITTEPAVGSDPTLPSASLMSLTSLGSLSTKYDFVPGTERLLSDPNAQQNSPWYFFGFEPDESGRPLDQSSAVCKLCLMQVSCSGGTAGLQKHLTKQHHLKLRETFRERSLTTGPQRTLSVANGVVGTLPVVLSTQVTNAIANFLVVDMQPPAVVEGSGFRQLLHTLLPAYKELPTPFQLEDLLKDHHARAKTGIFQLLRRNSGSGEYEDTSDITAPTEFEPRRLWHTFSFQREVSHFVTLSADIWVHSWQGTAERYLTLWAHFIDSNFSLHNLTLATQRLYESGADSFLSVESQIEGMAREWGISQPHLTLLGSARKNRTRPIKSEEDGDAVGSLSPPNSTTLLERDGSSSPEQASEVSHAREGPASVPASVPCFFGAVQGCIEEVMQHPVISKALGEFRAFLSSVFLPPAQSLISHQEHAQRLSRALTKQEHAWLKSWAYCSPPWNTLYPLLSTLVKHKSLLCEIVEDLRSEAFLKEDVASESSSSGSCNTISTSCPPSTSVPNPHAEWKVVDDLCLVLKPLDVACRTLAKDAFPRLSLVKPILTGLLSRHLVSRASSASPVLKEVKKMMRRHLLHCYESPAVTRALRVACVLDPQFHRLGFMDEQEQMATYSSLKSEALRIVKEDQRRSRGKRRNGSKRRPSPGSPESDSNSLRRSKRLKGYESVSYKQMHGEEGEDRGDGEDGEDGEDGDSDVWEPEEEELADPLSQGGLSGMEFLLGDLFSSPPNSQQSSVEDSLDLELSVFRSEKGGALGVEPLQWWRTKASQFPLLATVARAYLAAPAVAGNAVLDFLEDGATSRKKSNIPPDSLDAILFLHHNQKATPKRGRTIVRGEDRSSGGEKDP